MHNAHLGIMRGADYVCSICEAPVVLCDCWDAAEDQPNAHCPKCNGTGWLLIADLPVKESR